DSAGEECLPFTAWRRGRTIRLLLFVDVRADHLLSFGVSAVDVRGHGLPVYGNPRSNGVDHLAAFAEHGYALIRARALRGNSLPRPRDDLAVAAFGGNGEVD